MIELRTQKQLRSVRNLNFCCICGETFAAGEIPDRQHVPPKAIFAKADQSPPLILPAHKTCNNNQSPLDEVIGQLVSIRHGKYPLPQNVKLKAAVVPARGGGIKAGVEDLPLKKIIFRWVRCFHAALYRSYFVGDQLGEIYEPFQTADLVGRELVFRRTPIARETLTHLFKQQMRAGRTDAIVCYNEKCHYRCSWLKLDDGRPFCLFGLRLYDWEQLGDPASPRMGCVGFYVAPIPSIAVRGTELDVYVPNLVPLDPFGP